MRQRAKCQEQHAVQEEQNAANTSRDHYLETIQLAISIVEFPRAVKYVVAGHLVYTGENDATHNRHDNLAQQEMHVKQPEKPVIG